MNLNGCLSEYQSVEYGVPQGSVLGPILFSIFINDLANRVNNDLQMYADDSTLFDSDPNILQFKLDRVYNWCQTNLLTLNIRKTKWMLVGSQRQRSISQDKFEIAGTQLERVTSYKYLGLLLDEHLDFREQRTKTINHVQSKLTLFAKIRVFLTTTAAETVYKTMILPLLDYADFLYDQGIIYSNKKLQRLQNRGLRIIYNQHLKKYDDQLSMDVLHQMAKLSRLKYRRHMHLLLYAFDLRSDQKNIDMRNLPTRGQKGVKLLVRKVNGPRYYKSVYNRAVNAWNKLDSKYTTIMVKQSFKAGFLNLGVATPLGVA